MLSPKKWEILFSARRGIFQSSIEFIIAVHHLELEFYHKAEFVIFFFFCLRLFIRIQLIIISLE